MTTSSDTSAGVRVSNDDRERVASVLRQAAADGFLSLDEADERLAASYTARYRHDLEPLTVDLPQGGRGLFAASPEGRAAAARARADARAGLVWHAWLVAALAAVMVTAWALSGARHFFPAPVLLLGGLSLVLHAHRLRWAGYQRPYRGGRRRYRDEP